MARRLMTVLCPSMHEIARVEMLRGRQCIAARFPIAKRSPQGPKGAILAGANLQWGFMGDVRECAADGDQVITGCDCGTHVIAASWILSQLNTLTKRRGDVSHEPQGPAQPFAPVTFLPSRTEVETSG